MAGVLRADCSPVGLSNLGNLINRKLAFVSLIRHLGKQEVGLKGNVRFGLRPMLGMMKRLSDLIQSPCLTDTIPLRFPLNVWHSSRTVCQEEVGRGLEKRCLIFNVILDILLHFYNSSFPVYL